jgi:hypothetical protein
VNGGATAFYDFLRPWEIGGCSLLVYVVEELVSNQTRPVDELDELIYGRPRTRWRREAAMDVAWMLGPESPAGDWEVRMSMRSFWTHYLAAAQYWIIGHIPAWIDAEKVKCLPWPDPYRRCKDANLLHKALRLALEPQISDPFILCSDDHLLLRPSAAEDFKLWHGGEILKEPVEGLTKWQLRLVHTGLRLRNAGYPAMNFDAHVPYPLHKEWVKEALRFDFAAKPGMCVFSTILNCGKEPGASLDKQHVRAWLGKPDLAEHTVDARLARCQFACLTDKSMENNYIVSTVEQLFPEPAPWELDAATWPRRSQAIVVSQSADRLIET